MTPAILFVRRVVDGVVRAYEEGRAPFVEGGAWEWLCGPRFCTFSDGNPVPNVKACPCGRAQRGPWSAEAYYQ